MKYTTVVDRIPKPAYVSIVRWLPIPTVDVVVVTPDRKKTLVGLRTNRPAKNSWYTLGGRLQKHEHIESRAIRALSQEAGITVSPTRLKFAGVQDEEFPDSAWGTMSTHCLNIFFFLSLAERQVQANNEHSRLSWLPVNSKLIHPLARQKINRALTRL